MCTVHRVPSPPPGRNLFCRPYIVTDWLCYVLWALILLYFTGFNLMTRNPNK